MGDDLTPDEATIRLASIPEYAWLVESGKQWWTVAEVADRMGVSRDVVRAWCDRGEITGAVLYAAQVGWRLPRSGLLVYFAGLQQRGESNRSAG